MMRRRLPVLITPVIFLLAIQAPGTQQLLANIARRRAPA